MYVGANWPRLPICWSWRFALQTMVVVADDPHIDAVESARGEVTRDVSYVAAGERVPPGWLSYSQLMDSASEDPPGPPDEITGLGPSMIYTSGTTGHPKGTWRPNGVNVENVMQMISIFELSAEDVHLVCGPGYHSAVAMFSALHHLLGSTIVVQPKFEAGASLDLIEQHRVTTTMMAPTLLRRLLDAQEARPRDLGSLRAVFLEGVAAELPSPRPLTPRRAAKQQFGGLTDRERDVAALITRGYSNREIADRLVLSERTVETHVRSILDRLAMSSRAQVAAWAQAHGLGLPTTV